MKKRSNSRRACMKFYVGAIFMCFRKSNIGFLQNKEHSKDNAPIYIYIGD